MAIYNKLWRYDYIDGHLYSYFHEKAHKFHIQSNLERFSALDSVTNEDAIVNALIPSTFLVSICE